MAAWPVMRAFLVAPLITNTMGFLASSTMSMVRPTASRSSGDGRVGISTRSASPTTARIRLVAWGGVSMMTSLNPPALRLLDMLRQVLQAAGEEHRDFCLSPVPPAGQAALRVRVDQDDRALPCPLGLYREVARQGRLPCAAFLEQNQHMHDGFHPG